MEQGLCRPTQLHRAGTRGPSLLQNMEGWYDEFAACRFMYDTQHCVTKKLPRSCTRKMYTSAIN